VIVFVVIFISVSIYIINFSITIFLNYQIWVILTLPLIILYFTLSKLREILKLRKLIARNKILLTKYCFELDEFTYKVDINTKSMINDLGETINFDIEYLKVKYVTSNLNITKKGFIIENSKDRTELKIFTTLNISKDHDLVIDYIIEILNIDLVGIDYKLNRVSQGLPVR
jgi:hypothetical protein